MKVGDKGVIVNAKHKQNNGKLIEITSISRNKVTGNVILHVEAVIEPKSAKFDRYIIGLENFMSLPKITQVNSKISSVCKKVPFEEMFTKEEIKTSLEEEAKARK
jgi:hypothetical protein